MNGVTGPLPGYLAAFCLYWFDFLLPASVFSNGVIGVAAARTPLWPAQFWI
jgi:hypothetical protein